MKKDRITCVIVKQEDGYMVLCPEAHGVKGYGATEDEAIDDLRVKVKAGIKQRMDELMAEYGDRAYVFKYRRGEPLPDMSEAEEWFRVSRGKRSSSEG